MEFFPLTLGVPKRRTPKRERDAHPLDYDSWRESASLAEEFEPHAAEDVLMRLIRGDPALPKRPWLILGEPGAGKTRLMEHWHATWLRQIPQPVLGMRVPVLVRLKEIPRSVLMGDPDTVADGLWSSGLRTGKAQANGTASAAVFGVSRRVFTPVWLLDGLDEWSGPIADRGFWDLLRALPGEVAVTCRTAVFQAARAEIAGLTGNEWRILGLKPQREQANFLGQAYADNGIDPTCAEQMVRDLNANASLRPLAASPLMLILVAEAGPDMRLPATRAGFYEAATNALWERRLRDRPDQLDLRPERDAALTALAARLGLGALEIRQEALREAGAGRELREALRLSGLLRFDDRGDRVGFPHLTFQEFHLARALVARPFGDVLEEHWRDPRYEETLALLVALHAGEARGRSLVETALRNFVAKYRASHIADPEPLWSQGRSPLRTALHVLARAAVSPKLPLPLALGNEPALLRLAVACDPAMPASALAELARDPDADVRWETAGNAATPASALAELARDPDSWVRSRAAGNAATPASTLGELARDPDANVRWETLGNAATPASALIEFTRNPNKHVREAAAKNAATPASALAELARDRDWDVRWTASRNTATPASALAELARDPEWIVREAAAENAATPASTLAELARDHVAQVREAAAKNAATTPATLSKLARDRQENVRWAARANAATPASALVEFARDADVRHGAAALAELARDPDVRVRREAAWNAATPASALAELARDRNWEVREGVAWNAATPGAALAKLTRDRNAQVRLNAMMNAATPPTVMAGLALAFFEDARLWAAFNPATPAAARVGLARDRKKNVRWYVADNPATPAAALAGLAQDRVWKVRRSAARNARTLLEDLAEPAGPAPGRNGWLRRWLGF